MTATDHPAGTGDTATRFLALPGRERLMVVQAAALVLTMAPALRLCGVRRVHDWLEWRAHRVPVRPEGAEAEVRRLASLVEAVTRRIAPSRTCLERSLVLWYLCRRRGLEATIALGARRGAATLEAHAWVEHGGLVINDVADVQARYVPMSWNALRRRG